MVSAIEDVGSIPAFGIKCSIGVNGSIKPFQG